MDFQTYIIGFVTITLLAFIMKSKNDEKIIVPLVTLDTNITFPKTKTSRREEIEKDVIEMETLGYVKPVTWAGRNPKTHDGKELSFALTESQDIIIRKTETEISNSQSMNECKYCSMRHFGGCHAAPIPEKFQINMLNYIDNKSIEKVMLGRGSWKPSLEMQSPYKFSIKWDKVIDIKGMQISAKGLKSLKIFKNHEHQVLAKWIPPQCSEKQMSANINFENIITTDFLVIIIEPLSQDFELTNLEFNF